MPTFEITDKASGRKFRITGPSKEGALAALKSALAKEEAAHAAKVQAGKVNPETGNAIPEFVPMGQDGKPIPGYDPQAGNVAHTSAGDKFGAFTGSVLEGVPVAGPSLRSGAESVAAGLASATGGGDYGTLKRQATAATNQEIADNPHTALAGQVTGAVAPMIAGGATAIGGRLLGTTGSLAARTLAGGTSNAIISGADTAARGGDLSDILKSAAIGGAVGTVLPAAGDAVSAGVRGIYDTVAPRINALIRPAQEAEKRVGARLLKDQANTAVPLLSAADEAAAARNGQSLLNVDRGGEATRSLLKSAADNDAGARGLVDRTVKDRFAAQTARTESFIDTIIGGDPDATVAQAAVNAAKKAVNGPAYKLAESATAAQDMSDQGLLDMLRSPAVRQAAADAEKRSANRAVVEGGKPVKSPFVFAEDGSVSMKPGVKPTLRFWDQVKRNLDGMISEAKDSTLRSDLTALKGKLVDQLDAAVPEYQAARQGAFKLFQAENALEAGQKFVLQNFSNKEVAAALAKMTPLERNQFALGFAAKLKAYVHSIGDSRNIVTDKIWASPQAKEKIVLALGPQRAHEFEQFMKVESAMDQLRGAMGNSKTVQYMIESLAAGTGVGYFTGDWQKGIGAAIVTGLGRRYGMHVDQTMAKQVAKILLSDSPTALNRATKMAAANPKAARAVEELQRVVGLALRGGGDTITAPKPQPLRLTVHPQPQQPAG